MVIGQVALFLLVYSAQAGAGQGRLSLAALREEFSLCDEAVNSLARDYTDRWMSALAGMGPLRIEAQLGWMAGVPLTATYTSVVGAAWTLQPGDRAFERSPMQIQRLSVMLPWLSFLPVTPGLGSRWITTGEGQSRRVDEWFVTLHNLLGFGRLTTPHPSWRMRLSNLVVPNWFVLNFATPRDSDAGPRENDIAVDARNDGVLAIAYGVSPLELVWLLNLLGVEMGHLPLDWYTAPGSSPFKLAILGGLRHRTVGSFNKAVRATLLGLSETAATLAAAPDINYGLGEASRRWLAAAAAKRQVLEGQTLAEFLRAGFSRIRQRTTEGIRYVGSRLVRRR